MFKRFGLYHDAYSQRLAQMQQVVAEIKAVSQPDPAQTAPLPQLSQPPQQPQQPKPLPPLPSSLGHLPMLANGREFLAASVRPASAIQNIQNIPHPSKSDLRIAPTVSQTGEPISEHPVTGVSPPDTGPYSQISIERPGELQAASTRPANFASSSPSLPIGGVSAPNHPLLNVGSISPPSVQAASVRPLESGPLGFHGQRSPSISSSSSISINVGENVYLPTALTPAVPPEIVRLPMSPDVEMLDALKVPALPGNVSYPQVHQDLAAQRPVLKRPRSNSGQEDLIKDAPDGNGLILKLSGSNKRAKESKTNKEKVKGKRKAAVPNSYGDESTYDTDDESDGGSEDDDAKTVATLYDQDGRPGKDTDFMKILKFLEAIASKLDVALSKESPVNSATPSSQLVHATIGEASTQTTLKRDRATRRRENLRPWDESAQQALDTRPTDPQQREKERVALQGYIRLLIMNALGRPLRTSPLPPGPPPEIDLPTLQSFFIKWDKDIHDEFNQTACAIITRKVIEDWSTLFSMSDWDDIFQMVKAHVKYLIKAYKRQEMGRDDPSERTRLLQAAATRRKHTTYQQRLYVTKIVPELKMHKRLLTDLGVDGTSSDEEDPERPGCYYVKKIKQLSSNVQELKQLFDHTFETLQKGTGAKGSRGRKRIRGRLVSNRKFRIQGLPVNCLNRKWFNKLTETQKSYYKFAPYEYNFTYPKELTSM